MCRPLSNFTTTDDQGHILTYDAWNRLIDVSNANGTDIENYAYDGANHRITQGSPMVNPTQLYYDSSWQVVDEVTGAGGNMLHAQYVWSPVYSDALILRDYDFNNNGTFQAKERVYMTTDADFNVTGMVILISGTDIADALPDSGTDGSVSFAELLLVAQNYGRTVPGGDVVGDFNHDGTVDFADELLVAQAEAAGATTGTFTWVMGLHAVYSAFGDPTFYTYNFSATSNNFLAIDYGPQGLYFDQNVGLAFAEQRARSLTEGTWLTVDPIRDGLNWYEDEDDGPINDVDPMGLATQGEPGWTGGMVRPANEVVNLAFYAFIPKGLGKADPNFGPGEWMPEPGQGPPPWRSLDDYIGGMHGGWNFVTDDRGFGGGSARVFSIGKVDADDIGHLKAKEPIFYSDTSGSSRAQYVYRFDGTFVQKQGPLKAKVGQEEQVWDISPCESKVYVHGSAAYPFLPGPAIDYYAYWDLHKDPGSHEVKVDLWVEHNKFPNYEGLVNGVDIYKYDAPLHGETGPGFWNLTHTVIGTGKNY